MTENTSTAVHKNIILLISTTTAFFMTFLVGAVNVALPTIGREFQMEAVALSWMSTIYFLAIAIVQVPCGRLSDIFGRKRMYIIGLVIAAGASLIGAFASSIPLLLISRALQGMGAGLVFNNSVAILGSVFPSNERGRALGINLAGMYSGLALSPLIGGFMTEHLGWPSLFFLSGVLALLLMALIFWAMKGEWREARGEKFDIVGSILYAISIAPFIYGFSSLPSMLGIILFAVGIIGLFFFIRWELRVSSPVLDFNLLRNNRVFTFSNLAALTTYTSTYAIAFLLSLYLQYIMEYSPQEAGLILVVSSLMMAICTPIAGRMSDRIEPRLVATAGLVLICISLIMLIFLGDSTRLWYIILALAFYGTGLGLFSSPNTNAVMGSVNKRMLGVASGVIGTTRTAGMMLSMGVMLILFSLYIGGAEITEPYYPQFLTSVRIGFTVFTVCCIGGGISQAIARNRKPPSSH